MSGHLNQIVGRPMEILLVEDSLIDARITIEALKEGQVQHRLTLVRDGLEALDFLNHRERFARAPRPDLVLLDLMLPKLNGLEVLSNIRGAQPLAALPIVVLTASDDANDRAKCQLHHVDAFISKPVNLEKFLGVIKQLKRFWLDDVILPTVD